ncbi:T9SS type A sorting domain-containing protein [Dyadobacter sp. CY261]|uniref:T9SS type A sorting domain-containing protein n=1 Tax=Dyadobacter sp. CY261 TaxID=2907203 RepID=UPI001F3CC706|nr:T9SS type A sorting domain-containing protein [Dyadobacter sp. CY261]MCF0074888.1 T9SS type A sorting domain-containing protein [Dyadobacter sp. CY261]
MKHYYHLRTGMTLLALFITSFTFAQVTYYVSTSGNDGNTGQSAALPFRNLNKALSEAKASADPSVTIKVAAGTYFPTEAEALPELFGTGRQASFQVYRGDGLGKALFVEGGYNADFSARDIAANETILDGDVGVAGDKTDNSYHVTLIADQAIGAEDLVLDGFTIRNGYAFGGTNISLPSGTPIYNTQGAGINMTSNRSDKILISNNTITANEVQEYGGGIYFSYGYPNDGTFAGHPVHINKCIINSNVAQLGGGFYGTEAIDFILTECTFSNNQAIQYGGAGYVSRFANIKLQKSTFSSNSAVEQGGAIYGYGSTGNIVEVDECAFSNNSTNGNGIGGAIKQDGGLFSITNSSFTSNNSVNGGAIYNGFGSLSINNTSFTSNTGSRSGGAIWQWGGDLTIDNSSFATNTSSTTGTGGYPGGGAISFFGGYSGVPQSVVNIVNTSFEGNTVGTSQPGNAGGGISFMGTPVLNPEIFSVTIDQCRFISNSADKAGALHLAAGGLGTYTISNSVFKGNASTSADYGSGGAIYANYENIALTNNLFLQNQSASSGGAIWSYVFDGQTITNCTFYGNTAAVAGSAIHNLNAALKLRNNILWAQTTPVLNGNYDLANSLVQGGFPSGTNVLDTDPLFKDVADPDGADNILGTADDGLRLTACSPAVDYGDATDAPSLDMLGNARVNGNNSEGAEPDLGVYESQSVAISSAVIAGSATICSGSTTNLSIAIADGIAPYTVVYNDGTNDVTVNNYVSGGSIPVSPISTTTYTLVSATDQDGCVSASNSGSAAVTVTPPPTVANAGTDQNGEATCGLTTITLSANVPTVGTGQWSVVSGNGGSFADISNPASTFTGTVGTNYLLKWTISNAPCTESQDEVTIEFTPVTILANNNDTKSAFIPDDTDYNLTSTDCGMIASINGQGLSGTNPFIAKVAIDGSVLNYSGQPYLQRHFDLEPGVADPSASTATVTLYVSQAEFTAFNAASTVKLPANSTDVEDYKTNLRIWQWHGTPTTTPSAPGSYTGAQSSPIDPADPDITWNTALSAWEITFNVTGFSGFFITAENAEPLPVTLTHFSAQKQENSVTLNWQTTEEINSDYFEIQRSSDAKQWTGIGEVKAQGESKVFASYSYDDPLSSIANLTANGGQLTTIYYRLKMIDLDATFAYSRIVAMPMDGLAEIRVFPNPATREINLTGVERVTGYNIINLTGRIVVEKTGFEAATGKITLPDLPSGIYLLQLIKEDSAMETKRVVIVR